MEEATQKKEEGNNHFKAGRSEKALTCYTKALSLNSKSENESAVYYKNRAACYLKLNKFTEAAKDASAGTKMLNFHFLMSVSMSCCILHIYFDKFQLNFIVVSFYTC